MIRDVVFLILGLILIWTPRSWLRLGKAEGHSRRKRTVHGGPNRDRIPGDNSLWVGEEFGRRRNWVDLARALAGATAVVTTVPTLCEALIDVPNLHVENLSLVICGGILLAAVLIQMIRVEERLTLFPPIFFISGLAFPVVGIKASVIGFFAIWAINVVLPNAGAFLAAYGGLMVILSIFLGRGVKWAGLIGVLAIAPPLIAVLFRRRLAQFRKRTKIMVK